MYYVIKRQDGVPMTSFIGFQVPKYIASRNNENVILEFKKDGKSQRKWVKKEDIILLTEDKEFFFKILSQFREVEATQQKLVDEAQVKLNESKEIFTEKVNEEINKFNEIKNSEDIPDLLKNVYN